MSKESAEAISVRFFQYLQQHKAYYLIGRNKLNEIPQSLKSYTSWATRELIDAIGMPVIKARGEIFLFTSERSFVRGAHILKERENFANFELTCITASPALLLTRVLQLKPKIVHLDFGSPDALEVTEENLHLLQDLSAVAGLAKASKMLVLSDHKGNAVELQLEENKSYAVGFLEKEVSDETLASCKQDYPGAKLVSNSFMRVIEGVLSSPLAGIILNPGSPKQVTLENAQLELLCMVSKGSKKKGFFASLFSG